MLHGLILRRIWQRDKNGLLGDVLWNITLYIFIYVKDFNNNIMDNLIKSFLYLSLNKLYQKLKGQHMENAERRLELIKMMRNEQEENIGRIRKREHILYPNRKLSYMEPLENKQFSLSYRYSEKETDDRTSQRNNYGFYMRLTICTGLFLLFVYMETQNISYFGITHEQIQTAVSQTIDVNSFAFMEQFPYTLEE